MIIIKYRKSCKDSYTYKRLGLNSIESQKDYVYIIKNYPDVVIKGA